MICFPSVQSPNRPEKINTSSLEKPTRSSIGNTSLTINFLSFLPELSREDKKLKPVFTDPDLLKKPTIQPLSFVSVKPTE
jgi:hypothetical protein